MNNVDMSTFRDYCQSLDFRTRLNLRLELEEKTGYSHSGVWNWMNGTRTPKKPTREVIANVVHIAAKELFPGH